MHVSAAAASLCIQRIGALPSLPTRGEVEGVLENWEKSKRGIDQMDQFDALLLGKNKQRQNSAATTGA